jgi:ZIP family zinc transporter
MNRINQMIIGGNKMEYLMNVTMIGFLSGIIGTGGGGLASFLINKRGNRFMSFILEFSGGLMMAVVCFDLLPEAFELGGLKFGIAGIIIGVIVIVYLENILNQFDSKKKVTTSNNRLLRAGILMGTGIALHNLPEGIAIGSGFGASTTLGLGLAFVIAIHDIPEGLAMALPMKAGGMKSLRVLVYTLLAGIPTGFGAFVGALLGEISDELISLCLGFAGGAMLYIVCGDIIPESKMIYKGRISTIGNILGIILGTIISIGTH